MWLWRGWLACLVSHFVWSDRMSINASLNPTFFCKKLRQQNLIQNQQVKRNRYSNFLRWICIIKLQSGKYIPTNRKLRVVISDAKLQISECFVSRWKSPSFPCYPVNRQCLQLWNVLHHLHLRLKLWFS